jgi:hypothetical protein
VIWTHYSPIMYDTLFLAKSELSYYDSSMSSLLRQCKVNGHALADKAGGLHETPSFFRTKDRGE